MTTHSSGQPLNRRLNEERFVPLTSQEQTELSAKLLDAIENEDAPARRAIRDQLVERHLRLVSAIARGYEHKLDAEEAFAVGAVALTEDM